jgi:diaminopimelate epimerase
VTRAHLVSGGGNDFLALIEPPREPGETEIAAWCARGVSVGADGVFTLARAGDAVRMDYWNADGRPAALCLNGTRCAARLAFELGWAREQVTVATGAGPFVARPSGATAIALELPRPDSLPRCQPVEVDGEPIDGWFVPVGVPYYVVVWPRSLADCPVAELGAKLRRHAAFGAAGANVDFVRYPDPHRIEVRTFERGVEAETLASGTGVLAAVAVGLQLSLSKLPVAALTRGGFVLEVAGETIGSAPSRWTLAGDARLLGTIDLSAESALPPPPAPAWTD